MGNQFIVESILNAMQVAIVDTQRLELGSAD